MTAAIVAPFRCSACGSTVKPAHSHGRCTSCSRAACPPDPLAAMLMDPAQTDERAALYDRHFGPIPYHCGDGRHPRQCGYQGSRTRRTRGEARH